MNREAQEVSYSIEDAAKVTGASYPNVLYWMRSGLIEPSIQQVRGHGVPIQLSFSDVLQIKLIQTLRESKAPLQRIRKTLDCIRDLGYGELGSVYLDVTSDDIHIYSEPRHIMSAVKKRGQLLLVNGHVLLKEVEDETRRRGLDLAGGMQ